MSKRGVVIAVCRETGTPLGCIFQTRWSEDFRKAKARLDAGELGSLTYGAIRVPWWRKDEYYTESSWHGVSRPDALAFADHQACFEAFADSLEPGGVPYPIPGEEARKSVDLIERIYKSAGLR